MLDLYYCEDFDDLLIKKRIFTLNSKDIADTLTRVSKIGTNRTKIF